MGFKIKLEIDVDNIIDSLFADASVEDGGAYQSRSFNDDLRATIIHQASAEIRKVVMSQALNLMNEEVTRTTREFIETELRGIVVRKLRAGDFRDAGGRGFVSYDDAIGKLLLQHNLKKAMDEIVNIKVQIFAKELRDRYDAAFATRFITTLRDNDMLRPDVVRALLEAGEK